MFDGPLGELIDELGKLPGVGPKSAQRIAFFVIQNPTYEPGQLANVLGTIRESISFCETCGMIANDSGCAICGDPKRDQSVVCVVEEVKDVWAIERTREFRGLYHVLGGALSPIDGLGPENLRIRELMQRLSDGAVNEVIVATDPNLEGEATASYLSRVLVQPGLTVTRLASGLPVGGDLEYADEVTLGRAFAGRRSLS
jgi:recombination protein RecR